MAKIIYAPVHISLALPGEDPYYAPHTDAGWSSMVARRAHNPKVVGSNPAPATKFKPTWFSMSAFSLQPRKNSHQKKR